MEVAHGKGWNFHLQIISNISPTPKPVFLNVIFTAPDENIPVPSSTPTIGRLHNHGDILCPHLSLGAGYKKTAWDIHLTAIEVREYPQTK